jgi:excisionase family DNA binding protein
VTANTTIQLSEFMPEFVRPKYAAAILQCHRSHLYRLLRDRKIRARRDGKATWIETESIKDYQRSLPVWEPA